VNFSPLQKDDEVNQFSFDVYFDEAKEVRKYKYISIDKNSKIEYTNDVSEKDLQNKAYCLILPVSSFGVPA